LTSHIAILSNGVVVPCCLDFEGVIALGNLHNQKLSDIIASKKVMDIYDGFQNGKCIEDLCKKCQYKLRFGK
jgi:radical SAM protein with 4Fe4S-binding SPASM domain